MIEELLQSDTICRELTELQMQMVYCMGTERDATKIQQEIIPDILKNKPLHIKPEALEEEDIEEMIHPEEFDDKCRRWKNRLDAWWICRNKARMYSSVVSHR